MQITLMCCHDPLESLTILPKMNLGLLNWCRELADYHHEPLVFTLHFCPTVRPFVGLFVYLFAFGEDTV